MSKKKKKHWERHSRMGSLCRRMSIPFVVAGDEKGKFFVGLSDILQALAFAEDEADVPEIPQEWWEEIGKLYSA